MHLYRSGRGAIVAWRQAGINEAAGTVAPRTPWQERVLRQSRVQWRDRPAAGGGTSQSVGQAAETDTALALVALQARALGQATETDLAQPIVARQVRTLGQATETDAAQPLTARHVATLGQPVETDLAQPVTFSAPGSIGQAAETDLAQPISSRQARALGMASETDSAQALSIIRTLAPGMALEIDTAQPLVAAQSRVLGQAEEVDSAGSVTQPTAGGGACAEEVWATEVQPGVTALAAMSLMLDRLERIEKFLRNKQITDPVTGRMVVYEDDGSTVFAAGDLFEDAGGTQRYRGQGGERRERLT